MGWFDKRKAQTEVSPDQNDTNVESPARIIPSGEHPTWVADSAIRAGRANPFEVDPTAIVYSVPRIPDPAQGGYVEESNPLGWSDGLGKAVSKRMPFQGEILDPYIDPLRANAGGMVGLTSRTEKLGQKVATMYFPDNASDAEVAAAYEAYFRGSNN